ncbi:hypothetical protein D3C71_1727590 [compost metagenome]
MRTAGYEYSLGNTSSSFRGYIFSKSGDTAGGLRASGWRSESGSAELILDSRSGDEQICQAIVTGRWVQGLHLLLPVQEGQGVQGGDLKVIACHAIDLCFDGP